MATKALYFLLLVVPVLCVRPRRDYLLRTSSPPKHHKPAVARDFEGQLILTEYLEAGNIEEAQNLSKVHGSDFPEDIPSYSGYFTIDKKNGSNTFFWFFPAENDYENAPVVLWLQGGPGSTSLFGLFVEMGPFTVPENSSTLVKNPYSWHKNHSLLFIDNPVGSGYSYTTTDSYAEDEIRIGNDLYAAMVQFFTLFPNLQKNDFFVAGESYAGKYIPALGHTIHQNNPNASLKINLKGLIIGDGLVDPIHQLDYSDYVYQVGLVDNSTWKAMKKVEAEAVQFIEKGDYLNGAKKWSNTISIFEEVSQIDYYNIIPENEGGSESYMDFVEKNSTRAALHVGNVEYNDMNGFVYYYLENDMMKSVKPWVEELLDAGYRVIFYNGQLDVIVAYPLSENMFQYLQFKDADEYKNAKRKIWSNGEEIYGYTKTAGGLTEILVRNAGHLLPLDQPAVAFDLIYRATRNKF